MALIRFCRFLARFFQTSTDTEATGFGDSSSLGCMTCCTFAGLLRCPDGLSPEERPAFEEERRVGEETGGGATPWADDVTREALEMPEMPPEMLPEVLCRRFEA